jgi:malate dehydrogenase (oxaloacetate-decarboxylating)(NADP+)
LKVVGKSIKEVKLVASGAGAASLACLSLLVDLGMPIENIYVTDLAGVVYKGRTELMDPDKERFARETDARTLSEVMGGADVFLGLSAGGVLKQDMVKQMADKPLILALANPTPEILPELALEVRPDAVIATGRTDYPTSCAFRLSSAARLTSARRSSRRKWKSPRSMRSRNWRARNNLTSSRRLTAFRTCHSVRNI